MTVASTVREAASLTNGVTRAFPIPFKVMLASDLVVTLERDGAVAVLTEGVDYTIAGALKAGTATLTTTIAYPGGGVLRRRRLTARTQSLDLVPNDGAPADAQEDAYDRAILIAQELDADLGELGGRAVRTPIGETIAPLPSRLARAGKILGFTAAGALALFTPVTPVMDLSAIERLLPYSVASEPKLAGETDDNGRFTRAMAKVTNPFDAANFRRPLMLDPGLGSGRIDPSAPTTDQTLNPLTMQPLGTAMSAERLPKNGDWIIDDFASYTPEGAAKGDGSLKAGVTVLGIEGETRWRKSPHKSYFLFAYKAGTGTVGAPDEQYYTLANITIRGITFVESNWLDGFFESMACISVHAVDNLLIERCRFLNFRRDGIYVGASDKGNGTENRHNRRVTIRYCLFDGFNNNNRQPISIQDCDGLRIHDNVAVNCCKQGGSGIVGFNKMLPSSGLQMPARLVDFEPNIEVLNPIVRDCQVWGNTVLDGGGDAFNVFLRGNNGIPIAEQAISIFGNFVEKGRSALAVFCYEGSTTPYSVGREGDYSDHPADRGGPTRWGVTEQVARANGYRGAMRELPRETAVAIYRSRYWTRPGFDQVAAVAATIGTELLDTGINMGPKVAAGFLQRALNVLNRGASDYPDIAADGDIGPMTMQALRGFLAKRGAAGEQVLMKAIEGLQAERYIALAEGRPANEAFVYGWLANRIGQP